MQVKKAYRYLQHLQTALNTAVKRGSVSAKDAEKQLLKVL